MNPVPENIETAAYCIALATFLAVMLLIASHLDKPKRRPPWG
jgi:hypothetical protein